jgi:NTP pyrophosphatase (non-canonical NTP hydrolase)
MTLIQYQNAPDISVDGQLIGNYQMVGIPMNDDSGTWDIEVNYQGKVIYYGEGFANGDAAYSMGRLEIARHAGNAVAEIVATQINSVVPGDLHKDILHWQQATFPQADNKGGFGKLVDEVGELRDALHAYDDAEDPSDIVESRTHLEEELGDCFIVLSSLASRNNIDIERCAREKMAVNKARRRDADGNRIRD